jgi:polyisoprenoid-binding protein YceI
MKTKSAIIALVIIALGLGGYAYITRPLSAPTTDIQSEVQHLPQEQVSQEGKVLSIVSNQSKAEFSLNEVLNGKPTLVVGTTNQIGGEIKIKSTAPVAMTIGEVKVDARTLKTDNENRNGALVRLILKSEDKGNEYISFKTKTVTGLPETIETGKEFAYTINGDLTIRGVTKPVSFNAKSILNKDGSLTGSATSMVTYGDFGISVPNLSFLANVDKTVKLSLSLVAR